MARRKDVDWSVSTGTLGDPTSVDQAQLATLMDIRDELKRLNTLLHCHNFTDIPNILRGIRTKLPARKRKKRARG